MPKEEKLTLNERRKYLRLIRKWYLTTSKLERGHLLDEMGAVTGLHRKSRLRQDEHRLPRRGPAQANRVARGIPMKRIPWNEQQPGHFEVDAVHHCGISSAGHYIHTIQMVDVATGWTEQAATLGRGYRVMEDGFCRILARLPFPVLEIHPDNGSEGLIARFYNTEDYTVQAEVSVCRPFRRAMVVNLNEENLRQLRTQRESRVSLPVRGKGIVILKFERD